MDLIIDKNLLNIIRLCIVYCVSVYFVTFLVEVFARQQIKSYVREDSSFTSHGL